MSGFAVVAITAAQNARIAVARAGRCALRHARTGVVPVVVGIEVPYRVGIQCVVAVVTVQVIAHIAPSADRRRCSGSWPDCRKYPRRCPDNKSHRSDAVICSFRYNHHPHRCTLSAAPGWMSEFAVVAITAGQNARIAVARAGRSALRHARTGVVPVVVSIEVPDGIGMEMRRWLSSQSEVIGHISRRRAPLQELRLMAGLPKAVAVIVLIISHIEVMPSSVMFRYNHHPHRCTLSAAPGWMSKFAVVAITAAQNARIAVARAGGSALRHARTGVVSIVVSIEVPDGIGMEIVVVAVVTV
jgi:hypothetical protein